MSDEVHLSKAEVLKAIRTDCVAFFSLYLGEELTMEVPEFHEDIWGELLERVETLNRPGVIHTLHKLFAVPREHAKSTIAKLAVILLLKYTPLMFVLYASKTVGHAKNAIIDIIRWLSSEAERELHGPMVTIKSSETEGLWIIKMSIREDINSPPRVKLCIFKALGAEMQIRGLLIYNTRPQIIVADDIEDLDNTTPELQPKLDRWFFGSFLKSFAATHIVIFIGNMIRETTILARLAKDPMWSPTVFGSIVRDTNHELQPLWPGRHTVESLLAEYRMFRRNGQGATWEAEMMNLTQDAIFRQDMKGAIFYPTPSAEDIESGAIVLDPAFGKERWNDDSAFTVHVRIRGKPIPCVIDHRVGKYKEDELFQIFLELSYMWGLTTWVIEGNAAQKLLISLFKLMIVDRKMNPSLFIIIPINRDHNSKGSHILAFRTIVKKGDYALAESELELADKLGEYSPQNKQHDDWCDSASYGAVLWEYAGATIDFAGVKQVAMLAYGDGESMDSEIQLSNQVAGW
jgi:hypothetical protein